MRVLVTAGNTQVLIDRVRCLTNIFTGRTGAQIALTAHSRGHEVTLLTSHPTVVQELSQGDPITDRFAIRSYRTFQDLESLMKSELTGQSWDVLIHSAAVSDYLAGGVFAPAPGTHFRPEEGRWESNQRHPTMVDRAAGKVKSDEDELWLRLVRAPKLVDKVRSEWGFRGTLIKFKLEVGISEDRLRDIAERSRQHSAADLMVANTLEGAQEWAIVGPLHGSYVHIARAELARHVVEQAERLSQEARHG